MRVRVLGLAADGSFAVLETDGRTVEAFGPAGVGDDFPTDVDLIGLEAGDAELLARRTGTPVACDFGHAGPAVYYRARARAAELQRPVAVVEGDHVIHIAENGLLTIDHDVGEARTVIRSADEAGWRRAEAIAYLAARVWNGFPIAFPGTTGAPYPMADGRIVRPPGLKNRS
jgi:1,6-anhydro-N-acetylmuramate kinase